MNRSDVLWGIAVADAIGNPLEFKAPVTHAMFVQAVEAPILFASDDTQMTLFLAEALATGKSSEDAYVRWYHTQIADPEPLDGLLGFPDLYRCEAPGATCMSACRALSEGLKVSNDSKGNGTVMRCAPIAMHGYERGWDAQRTQRAAFDDAMLTHKHPFAGLSSALLTAIYLNLFDGLAIVPAVTKALDEATSFDGGVVDPVRSALDPAQFSTMPETLGGWVTEEALALAVGSVAHSSDYLSAIERACCIPGDSDTVAGIAGGLAAASGMQAPQHLRDKLNLKPALEYVVGLY